MPLSDQEVEQLTLIESEFTRRDRRLNKKLRSLGCVNPWLLRLSRLASALAVVLVMIGAVTELPQAYVSAWFMLLLALVTGCSAHLASATTLPETLD